MKTEEFDYHLPEKSIAQFPAQPRDASKLLVFDRQSQKTEHRHFYNVVEYLQPGDVLVLNETKVIPARLFGKKRDSSVEVEFLLLKRLSLTNWDVIMRPGKRIKVGGYVEFGEEFRAKLIEKKQDGVCEVEFEFQGIFENLLEQYGNIPLPPYITEKLKDKQQYQTVYAKEDGSSAAPTAGLHFTPELLQTLEKKGVILTRIVLHIGLGTFRPMKEETVEDHIMHSEYYSISEEAAEIINLAKQEGRRVVAVGTTSVRTLESAAKNGKVMAGDNETDIFIYPPYSFQIVDVLLTNFHLPKSTLIMLVSAFAGKEKTLELYCNAVDMGYRFFSLGDAMLIL